MGLNSNSSGGLITDSWFINKATCRLSIKYNSGAWKEFKSQYLLSTQQSFKTQSKSPYLCPLKPLNFLQIVIRPTLGFEFKSIFENRRNCLFFVQRRVNLSLFHSNNIGLLIISLNVFEIIWILILGIQKIK